MSTGGPITRSRARSSTQHKELRWIISQALAPIHEELKALPRKAVIEETNANKLTINFDPKCQVTIFSNQETSACQ